MLNQPIERVRLIQISLFTLVAALAVRMTGVVPAVDVALLPVEKSYANTTSVVDMTGRPPSSTGTAGGELSLLTIEREAIDSRNAIVPTAATTLQEPTAAPEAAAIAVKATSGARIHLVV